MVRRGIAALAALLIVAMAATPTSAKTENVTIQNVEYNPSEIVINAGDTVRWMHKDGGTPHTVTADDKSFDSSRNTGSAGCNLVPTADDCMYQNRNNSFSHTFARAGTFGYHCKIHATMRGVVRVRGRGATASSTPTTPATRSPSPTAGATATSPSPTASGTATGSPTGGVSPTADGTARAGADDGGGSGGKVAIAVVAVLLLSGAGFVVYRRFIASP